MRWCVGADGERFAAEEVQMKCPQLYSDPMCQRAWEAGYEQGVQDTLGEISPTPSVEDQAAFDTSVPPLFTVGTEQDAMDDLQMLDRQFEAITRKELESWHNG